MLFYPYIVPNGTFSLIHYQKIWQKTKYKPGYLPLSKRNQTQAIQYKIRKKRTLLIKGPRLYQAYTKDIPCSVQFRINI
jgi:hypothetical protein